MSTSPCSRAGITVSALTTGLIVTCRPALVNRPFACAMYKPAWASAGTTATTRSGFSGPVGLAEFAGLAEFELPPQAVAITAMPAIAIIARARHKERFGLEGPVNSAWLPRMGEL